MTIKLIIDNREKYIINMISNRNIEFTLENLNLGDINFYYDSKPILLIERKTMADLASSIKDGRHREQKFRLKSQKDICKVLYLFEGTPSDFKFQKINKDTIISAINNTFIRDGFFIKETTNLDETINFIIQMYHKIKIMGEKNLLDNMLLNVKESPYIDYLKMKKNTLVDPKNSFIMQLSQIPGISKTIAESISWKYPSMITLCKELESSSEDILCNLMIATSGKPRKLGKKISAVIYKYLGKELITS